MKTLLSVFLFIELVCCRPLHARLGEDEIQCEERYGFAKKDPATAANEKLYPLITGEGATTRTYLYQGWRIRIGFLDGVAVREEYWKVVGPGRNAAIADYESTPILEAEKGTATWQPKGIKPSTNIQQMLLEHLQHSLLGTFWIRSDGTATATMDMASMHLSFENVIAIQHDEAIKQANEQKQRASVPLF